MANGNTQSGSFESPEAAMRAICERLSALPVEHVSIRESIGRALAEPLVADRDSPTLDVSVMDGYALRAAGVSGERASIPVLGDAGIGSPPIDLAAGACMRTVTGAPIPNGADCVIRHEDVEAVGARIRLRAGVGETIKAGTNIRRKGENAAAGDAIVDRGTLVTPAVAGALAAFGCERPTVYRRVRVGVIVTGDELADAVATAMPWQLRDSNGHALGALLSSRAFVEPGFAVRHARDDAEEIRAAAGELLERCDAVLLTGGVSMGHRDFVPGVLAGLGVETVFHKVPQRPGRPILGGIGPRGQAVFGLPGNPVSVLVTARRMALAAVEKLAGLNPSRAPAVRMEEPDGRSLPLWWHRLVRLKGSGGVELVDTRGSGDVVAAARSDGFVEVPPGETGVGPWPYYGWM